jgi:hypothetical protein
MRVCKNRREFGKMKEYKIPVEWSVYGTIEVKAKSVEEAVKKAEEEKDDYPLPTENHYIEDTFKVNADLDLVEAMNK